MQVHPPTGCEVRFAGYEYYSLYCAIYTYINKNCHVHDRVHVRALVRDQWAIPLFNYTPLQMTINGVQGGYREYVPGGGGGGGVCVCVCVCVWSFKGLSRGVRRHNRGLSRGVVQNRSLSRGHLQVCPRGGSRYNISLSRGAFLYCPGGNRFAIIVICRGVQLNNGIAQLWLWLDPFCPRSTSKKDILITLCAYTQYG